jgi:hypothetical protein
MNKIRFLHIPKNAGSTFDDCLTKLYLSDVLLGRRFVFTGNIDLDRKALGAMSDRKLNSVRLFSGHAPLVTGIEAVDRLPTVTLLRSPVNRVISYCQHMSEGKSEGMPRQFDPGNMNLDTMLWSGAPVLSNVQTKALVGRAAYHKHCENPGKLVDLALRALKNDIACFGLVEQFDSSLLLFKQVLGWQGLPIYQMQNQKHPGALLQVDDRHRQKILELNSVDQLLYQVAATYLGERLRDCVPDVEQQLTSLDNGLAREAHPVFRLLNGLRRSKKLARRLMGK